MQAGLYSGNSIEQPGSALSIQGSLQNIITYGCLVSAAEFKLCNHYVLGSAAIALKPKPIALICSSFWISNQLGSR